MSSKIIHHHIVIFILILLAGYCFSLIFSEIKFEYIYADFLYFLLAIGLYGAVSGINTQECRHQLATIFYAITFGVIIKAIIIGTAFFLISGSPISFLLGIIVAQIDPLSVANLLGHSTQKRLSEKGETLLRVWSSFDDPITVLLALYIILPITLFGFSGGFANQISEYGLVLAYNFIFACSVFCITHVLKKVPKIHILEVFILICALIFAGYFELMLGIALVGLFLRPRIQDIIDGSVNGALYISIFIIGILLIPEFGIIIKGIALGLFCIISHIIATCILTRSYSVSDTIYLSLGQQNGITSIILSLIIASYFPEIIAIVIPAIITINVMHTILNSIADQFLLKTPGNKTS